MARKKAEETITPETIEGEILGVIESEKELKALESKLMLSDDFKKFIEMQKQVQAQSTLMWEAIQNAMAENNVKSVKGDWGSVTLVRKLGFDIDETKLPQEFFKRVPDVKKVRELYDLEGEAPEGADVKYSVYLMKRLK